MSDFAFAEDRSSQFHIDVEKYELKNGMRVLLNPDKKVHTASYILGIATGSRHERLGITGISHMFEHLMFKGTKKYPDFDEACGDRGLVGINAFTSLDYTAYLATFPPDQLEFVLDIESDRMVNLSFSQEDLDKERGAVQEERLMRVDNNPRGLLIENTLDLLFTRHPYRWPVIGYSKDIAAYTLRDLNEWYRTYYSPNNAVLVISGKFSSSKAKKLIEKYFGPLSSKNIPQEIKVTEPEQVRPRSRVVNKEVQAPMAVMAYKIPSSGSPEFAALEALGYILGEGESSVLYKKLVREKKLLSSVSVRVLDLLDYGVFMVTYSLPDLLKEQEVKDMILEEIKGITAQGLDGKSLQKVKNIKMNEMVFALKRSMYRAKTIWEHEIDFGDWKKMYEKLNVLDEMSSGMIQAAGQKYLKPEQLSYLILKSEKAEKASSVKPK